MNFKVIKQLYKKEILDVLRDKKTIIMMVIVPLLIYPLMFVGGMVMMSKVTTQMDTQTYEIAVDFKFSSPTYLPPQAAAISSRVNFFILITPCKILFVLYTLNIPKIPCFCNSGNIRRLYNYIQSVMQVLHNRLIY